MRRNPDDADLEAEEAADEEEADTDLETDRLLGQQRTDDQGFYDDKVSLSTLNRGAVLHHDNRDEDFSL